MRNEKGIWVNKNGVLASYWIFGAFSASDEIEGVYQRPLYPAEFQMKLDRGEGPLIEYSDWPKNFPRAHPILEHRGFIINFKEGRRL